MDNQNEKKFSKLIDRAMQDAQLELPSSNFTKKVMGQITALHDGKKLVYQPLIPKKALFLLGALFFGILLWSFSLIDPDSASWFSQTIGQGLFTTIKLPIDDFEFSKTVVYAIVLLGIMIFVQTYFLKGYFEDRLT